MPLSRLTQTLPLDLAEATSESEAAPEGAAFVAFLAGAGLEAGAVAGAPDELVDADLLAGGVAGAEAGAEAGAGASESAVLFFLRLFLGVADSALVPAEAD